MENENLPATIPGATLATTAPGATVGNQTTLELVMPPHVAAVVPFQDHAAYERLTLEQKKRLSSLLSIFAEIEAAPEGRVAATERLAVANGISAPRLHALRSAFKSNGWRALAKIYKGPSALPELFVQEVRRRIEANGRTTGTAAAIQQLKDDWAAGVSIPGYGTWREYWRATRPLDDIPERYPFGFFPKGWSESNLYTKQSSKAERAYKRLGRAAAQRYLPHLVRDTSGLRPLELITIDDFELDFLVRAFNPVRRQWEICTCAGLLAIDVATRRKLALAIVPRFKLTKKERAQAAAHIAANALADETAGESETEQDKATRISITRHDVQSLLHVVFSTWGRPANYGCTILCENASAAITADFELALELLLGVQVARTGLITEKTLKNGFVQGGGRPWEKGWIEALFRTAWNMLGTMPGQKGASYQLKPADHEAKVAYAMGLFKLDGLPADVAAKLRVPFLTIDEALDGLNAVFARIERRPDHRMIGFEDRPMYQLPGTAGLLTKEQLVDLPREQLVLAQEKPFKETQLERWERLIAQNPRVKIVDYVLACLLLTPKKVVLKNHRITFTHAGQGFTFADADSPVMKLPEGTELLGYFDHARPGVLHVTDLKGHYLGHARRRGAIDIRDHVAISAEAGEITRLIRACVEAPVRARHEGENQQLADDRAHNARLLQEHGIPLPESLSLPATDTAPTTRSLTGDKPKPTTPGRSPAALSKRLAQPLARDAFATYRDTLARGVAAEIGAADQRTALERQSRTDAERLTDDDIEAATGRRPTASEPAEQFSADEISDLLRDDPKK